jgi:peptidoglycan hydrolase CwlO-like protein
MRGLNEKIAEINGKEADMEKARRELDENLKGRERQIEERKRNLDQRDEN